MVFLRKPFLTFIYLFEKMFGIAVKYIFKFCARYAYILAVANPALPLIRPDEVKPS